MREYMTGRNDSTGGATSILLDTSQLQGKDLGPVLLELERRGWLEKIAVAVGEEELKVSLVLQDNVSPATAYETIQAFLQETNGNLETAKQVMGEGVREGVEAQTVRIEQAKIDKLLSLAGELIISSNGLMYLLRRLEDQGLSPETVRELKEYYIRVARTSWDIQDTVMEMRLMPVGVVFERFRRVVREMAQSLGKKVHLNVQGEEISVDRSVAAALYEPLLHLVRNALDHGLEDPETRRLCGKPETGRLLLAASRRGERVLIQVVDDGRGIDEEAVKAKALSRGWLTEERAATLKREELFDFLFRPGFSTKETASSISGRGVGMDVVRETVQSLGGRVSLKSEPGRGTEITLELPVTMSITKVLLLEDGGLYGIPAGEIREIVRVSRRRLRQVKGHNLVALRDNVYPVVNLSGLLGSGVAQTAEEEITLVILLNGLAVAVGKILGERDVVLKNLPPEIADVRLFSGVALLGSGDIALIIDVTALGGARVEP
ncbi:MAG: chemotaxis protein CheA [Moorellaceae bacterium]